MPSPLPEKVRTAILSSLGAGVVPSIGLQHIQVGRRAEVDAMLRDLRAVESGGASVRFVVGRFGAGKSFFLNVVRAVALERKFVVAAADITTERRLSGSGGAARGLYAELTRNFATRSRTDGGALASIIERWVGEVAHDASGAGSPMELKPKTPQIEAVITTRLRPLQDLVSGYDFAAVLSAYLRGFLDHNPELQTAAVRWLRGEYTSKTEARADLGVRTIIDDDSVYDYLKLWARFLRLAGYAGLMVCLDELVVLSHRLNNRTARDRNYEAILRIVNDCLQGSVEGLGVVFAATDDCLTDRRRGLFSYEALATRLADNRFAADGLADLSGPVIRLAPLRREDCYVLLLNLRRVFANGRDEQALLPDPALERYLASCEQRMGAASFQTPRDTVKDFVGLLNVLEQNPSADWAALIAGIKTRATTEPVPTAEDADESATRPVVPPAAPRAIPPADARDDGDLASFRL